MGIKEKISNKIRDIVGESTGVSGDDVQAGVRDPSPIASYYSNGMFQGYDRKLWLYFKMPDDVQVEWTKSYEESANNQTFMSNIFNALGKSLFNSGMTTRKDNRMRFHIPMIRELTDQVAKYDGITPAHADFINRMSGHHSHPIWHSYFGVELQMGDINSDVYGITNKVRNYVDHMLSRSDIEYNLYKESIELVTAVCMDNGMKPLDFSAEPADFERLSAWFGESDMRYGVRREMASAPMALPEHGKSIFTGDNEITFSAIRPRESRDMFMKNPYDSYQVRWGRALMRPSLNIVHINIRGEIRGPEVAASVFDNKVTKMEYQADNTSKTHENTTVSERKLLGAKMNHAEVASIQASRLGYAWLDNVEVTTAQVVTGRQRNLSEELHPYGLEAVNVTKRQHTALCSTVPCYPNPIFKIPSDNAKRNVNVNNFYSGVLAMSGLFRSTKPAGPGGILVGLSDAGFEFKEIFRELDAASKHSSYPVILITGATGSGKTVQMLSMIAQTTYIGGQAVFLNPKPNTTYKSFFDLLGGITVNLSTKYLNEFPGMLDPMFFIEDREQVGRILADMIIRAQGMNAASNSRMSAIRSMEELTTELIERAKMPANECSADIIFGNRRAAVPTPRLSDNDTVSFVKLKMKSSPFWKAAISEDPEARSTFQAAFATGSPVLIEWDNSIQLPGSDTDPDRWTPAEKDGVQSVVNLFSYATEIIGSGRRGGILAIDEAHHIRTSEACMGYIRRSGREWRSQNINLMLSTQNLSDFLDDDEYNIAEYVGLFIMMRVSGANKKEMEIFFDMTGLPRDEAHRDYIVNAGIKTAAGRKKLVPNAYVIDRAYEWEGGIICGPWPERELEAATANDDNSSFMSAQSEDFFEPGDMFGSGIDDIGESIDIHSDLDAEEV